jgi:hypothetical protein
MLAGAACLSLLAACGSVAAPRSDDEQAPAPAAIAAHGGHAQATRLAARLLTRVMLPAGAIRLTGHVPGALRQTSTPGVVQLIDLHRFRVLPESPGAATAFLLSHVPAGMRLDGTGFGTGLLEVNFRLAGLPPGIYSAGLAEAVAPGPSRGSVLRVDAQVAWYPARSAAERLSPATFRAVTVQHAGSAIRPVSRTISGRGQIASLASLLNGLPANPGITLHCRAETSSYQLTFRPEAAGRPALVVTANGCAIDQVRLVRCARPPLTYCSVSGGTQPGLWDPHERLAAAARRLLTNG